MTAKYRTPVVRLQVVRDGAAIPIRPKITSSEVACRVVSAFYRDRGDTREVVAVATLDTKHQPISFHVVSVGTLDASLVHPREVFRPAIHDGAAAILLMHNHPSEDPNPSRQDREVTYRLDQAAEVVGIQVLDHIVYGDGTGDCYSIRDGCVRVAATIAKEIV